MKKTGIFFAALLALGFASCDDKSDLGVAQVNPQETVMSANGVTVDYGTALKSDKLNLSDYADQQIPVINLVEAVDMPEGGEVSFVMQLASDANFTNPTDITVVDGAVSCADWDNWFRSTLGKSPAEKSNYVRFAAYIQVGDQLSRVGSTATWFAAKEVKVTPIPLDITIESAYYLIGSCNSWGLNDSFPFNHNDAVSVYDDPVFTRTITISDEEAAAGWWWKIAPQSAIDNQNWDVVLGIEVDGSGALEGKLLDVDGKAGCIKEAGTYLVTINLMDMTYSYKKMAYLYTPGSSNGWSQSASQQLTYDAEEGVYTGFAYLDGEFKFTDQLDWNGNNYGNAGIEGNLTTDPSAGNLSVSKAGLYYCVVDVENLVYSLTLIDTWGVIGGFNSWASSVALTPSADFLTWTGEVTLTSGDEFKFRANDAWNINLGGETSNLVANGANLVAPGTGTFAVTLDFTKVPYSCSVVAK